MAITLDRFHYPSVMIKSVYYTNYLPQQQKSSVGLRCGPFCPKKTENKNVTYCIKPAMLSIRSCCLHNLIQTLRQFGRSQTSLCKPSPVAQVHNLSRVRSHKLTLVFACIWLYKHAHVFHKRPTTILYL